MRSGIGDFRKMSSRISYGLAKLSILAVFLGCTASQGVIAVSGVVPRISNVAQVAIGHSAICARLADGTVSCWGATTSAVAQAHRDPARVSGLANVTQIDLTSEHACALLSDGSVECWGSNSFGELGDRDCTRIPCSEPARVGGIVAAAEVRVAAKNSCARMIDGTVSCWGQDALNPIYGKGNLAPQAIPGLNSVVRIAGVLDHFCALLSDRTVRCWGDNAYGQVDGHPTEVRVPVAQPAQPDVTGVAEIGVGEFFSCARLLDGSVECWGDHLVGQTWMTDSSYSIMGLPGGMTSLAIGGETACAREPTGAIWCWGAANNGLLGVPESALDHAKQRLGPDGLTTPLVQVQNVGDVSQIALGPAASCVLLGDASLRCWGTLAQ